eukprot:CAMPEP_0175986236 /NCGR_PEP_ID=MMETSP0108-20121206/50034_1 /TAXON_ID=195067 ORGANISM="Goniomonas pacifica, Strain CCMP1869" /NCGR_SAMPLE_ID=MMETSP0108 /ASSEMBLY_ACC=CAM_ASM_000204 /LENGTH=89 /DNA_ID=CAMNT_0017317365 /DNA_START=82 /DNA_END=351 /DNA_ORIENTATION=+
MWFTSRCAHLRSHSLPQIKRHTPFKKLMEAYCERLSLSMSNVIFLFDGNRLNATQTPNDLDMEDEDEIDACLHVRKIIAELCTNNTDAT